MSNLVFSDSINKVRLGRLAIYVATQNLTKLDPGITPLGVRLSNDRAETLEELLDLATWQESDYSLRKLKIVHNLKIHSWASLVPLAMPVELSLFQDQTGIVRLRHSDIMTFLFGSATHWAVKEYPFKNDHLEAVSAKEFVARTTKLIGKSAWDDTKWLTSLKLNDKLARFRFKHGLQKDLIHTMAYAEAWHHMEAKWKEENVNM